MAIPTPGPNEGRQEFLRRCMSAATADGMDEGAALAACTLVCRQHKLADASPCEQLSGSIELLEDPGPSGPDTSPGDGGETTPSRRFAILGYTGAVIERWYGRVIIDLEGMRLDSRLPALRDHEVDHIVGWVDSHSIDASGLQLRGVFSKTSKDSQEVLALADEGFPWQASIGVWAESVEEVEPGVAVQVNGRELAGPLTIWRKTYVREISFVPIGADENTAAVSLAAEERNMDKTQIPAAPQGEPENLSATPATPTVSGPAPAAAPAADALAAARSERERIVDIMRLCATHGISTEDQTAMISDGLSMDDARARVLDLLAKRPGGQPLGVVETGVDESDKFRAAAIDGLHMALGGRVEKPAPGAESFRSMSLGRLLRLSLRRAGVGNVDYLSPDQAARKFMGDQSLRLSASTSDFTHILGNVLNRQLREGAQAMPQTFTAWTSRTTADDFRERYSVALSDIPALPQVLENGEYPVLQMADSGERYKIYKHGGIFRVSLEMMVNDDLGAFSSLARKMGSAWEVTKGNLVYGLLLSATAKMADGKSLFDAAHGNLMTTGERITATALAGARKLMRLQKAPQGTPLNIAPTYLIVGAEYENEALVLLRSTALPDGNSATFNQWQGLTPIVESRLDAAGATVPWFLAANPVLAPTIEVAYLDNMEGVEVFEEPEFLTDGLAYKARGIMGVGAIDWRGMVKNPGKAAG